MNDIKEKISAFYDGELNLSSEEIDELITFKVLISLIAVIVGIYFVRRADNKKTT